MTALVLPSLLFTRVDVAGIGPEVLVKAWPALTELCRPVVVGDPYCLQRAAGMTRKVETLTHFAAWPSTADIACLRGSDVNLTGVPLGKVSRQAGQAAF